MVLNVVLHLPQHQQSAIPKPLPLFLLTDKVLDAGVVNVAARLLVRAVAAVAVVALDQRVGTSVREKLKSDNRVSLQRWTKKWSLGCVNCAWPCLADA